MNDQDRRAIESMILCGCELESVYAMFPKVPKSDIDEIYSEVKGQKPEANDTGMSINCS